MCVVCIVREPTNISMLPEGEPYGRLDSHVINSYKFVKLVKLR